MQGSLRVIYVYVLLLCGTGVLMGDTSRQCTRVWTIPELVRAAGRLDGQVLCVRSLLRPLPTGDRSSPSVFVYEAVPLPANQQNVAAYQIAIVDWDKEFGIDESLYRPESEEILREAAKRCPRMVADDVSFETEFRAVVKYKKGLTERAYAALPPELAVEKPRKRHYDVELVFLQVLKASPTCKK